MKIYLYLLIGFICFKTRAQLINDESYLDSEFVKFKNELLRCVINKGTTGLRSLLAERILESNDGCGNPGCTKDEFINMYFKYSRKVVGIQCLKL